MLFHCHEENAYQNHSGISLPTHQDDTTNRRTVTSDSKDVEKLDSSYAADRNLKLCGHLGSLAVPQKAEQITNDTAISLSEYTLEIKTGSHDKTCQEC